MTTIEGLKKQYQGRYNVTLVRDDGKTLGVDLVPANDEWHAAHTTVWFFVPSRWADGHPVKAYINGKEI